jgi:hypothetical protein
MHTEILLQEPEMTEEQFRNSVSKKEDNIKMHRKEIGFWMLIEFTFSYDSDSWWNLL